MIASCKALEAENPQCWTDDDCDPKWQCRLREDSSCSADGAEVSGTCIRSVKTHRLADGAVGQSWTLDSGGLPLRLGWTGMTQSPGFPSHFLAVNSSQGVSARDIDPFTPVLGAGAVETTHSVRSIYALDSAPLRMAWVGVGGAGTSGVFYFYWAGTGTISPLPLTCKDRTSNSCTPSLTRLTRHAT
jgi:hypothetical protein